MVPQSELSKALHARPFQMTGARFAMQHRNVLIADEPGLGKTIQSIAAVIGNKISGSVLVVAPKTAMYVTWPAELKRWLQDIAPNDIIRTIGGKQTRVERNATLRRMLQWDITYSKWPLNEDLDKGPRRQWVLVSPNYLRYNIALDEKGNYMYENNEKIVLPVKEASTAFLAIDWATIIVDEAHQTLAGATGNLKTQSAQSRGLRLLTVRQDGLRLALSGTPFRGKHENIWGILDWLDTEGTPAYWNWIKTHFDVYMDYVIGCEVIGGLKDEKKLARELRSVMIRRTKKQVVKELPDKLYGGGPVDPDHKPPPESARWTSEKVAQWYNKYNPVAVWLDMDGKQRKAYEQMRDVAMADIEGGTLMANSILAEIIRLKQFANSYGFLDDKGVFRPQLPSNKFDWILEFLDERGMLGQGGCGSKVVIASQFTKHINTFAYELQERYKTNCFVLTGATNEEQRVQFQREFQRGTTDLGNPSADVFLINTKAGGVSLTLDAADDIILVDNTRNPDDQLQVVDRVHRISRIHQVTVWNLATRDSVDENIIRDEHLMGMSLARILDQGGTDAVKRLIVG